MTEADQASQTQILQVLKIGDVTFEQTLGRILPKQELVIIEDLPLVGVKLSREINPNQILMAIGYLAPTLSGNEVGDALRQAKDEILQGRQLSELDPGVLNFAMAFVALSGLSS